MLQGDLWGKVPGVLGIRSEDLTHDFWSHVFLGKEYTSGKIAPFKLDKLR